MSKTKAARAVRPRPTASKVSHQSAGSKSAKAQEAAVLKRVRIQRGVLHALESRVAAAKRDIAIKERKVKEYRAEEEKHMKQSKALGVVSQKANRDAASAKSEAKQWQAKLAQAKRESETAMKASKRTESELTSARESLHKLNRAAVDLETQLAEGRKSVDESKAATASQEQKLAEAKAQVRDLELTNLMSKLILAGDMAGLEKWLVEDAPVVLEYVKDVKDESYFKTYRQYLYEQMLKKGYRFYQCSNCKGRFHADTNEPKSCPYCSSTELKLMDVANEVLSQSPRGALPYTTS